MCVDLLVTHKIYNYIYIYIIRTYISICTPIQWFLLFRPIPGLFDQPSAKKMCVRGYKRLKPGWPVVRHDVNGSSKRR